MHVHQLEARCLPEPCGLALRSFLCFDLEGCRRSCHSGELMRNWDLADWHHELHKGNLEGNATPHQARVTDLRKRDYTRPLSTAAWSYTHLLWLGTHLREKLTMGLIYTEVVTAAGVHGIKIKYQNKWINLRKDLDILFTHVYLLKCHVLQRCMLFISKQWQLDEQ